MKPPLFYYTYKGTSHLLNPMDADGGAYKPWSALVDFQVDLGLLSDGQDARVKLSLVSAKLEAEGIKIVKGHLLQVYAGDPRLEVFRGIVADVSQDPEGTTLELTALPLDQALKVDHPDLVDSLHFQSITIGEEGHAAISGHVHVVRLVDRANANDNPGCHAGSAKFVDGYMTIPANNAYATLIWHESPNYALTPSEKIYIPLARKDDTDTVGEDEFYVDIYRGATAEPDLTYNSPQDTWPWVRMSRWTFKYKNLKKYDDSDADANHAYVALTLPSMYSGAPYFAVIQNGAHGLAFMAGAGDDCRPKLIGRGLVWSHNIGSPQDDDVDMPGGAALASGFMYKWNRPKPQALQFSQFYDPSSDTTHINLKQDTSTADSIDAQAYYYSITPEGTMRLLQRLLWTVGYWPLMRTYYPDIYGPGKPGELTVRVPLGAIPAGTAMDTITKLAKLQGWVWMPAGYDPLGIVRGSPGNAAHPVFYDMSKLTTVQLSEQDLIERSIVSKSRPDPATMFIFKQKGLGEVQMPLFYEDIDADVWLKRLPLFGQVKMSTDNLSALAEAVARWVELDADGGTLTLKGHRPEILGQYVELPGGATFLVRGVHLNNDMTTTVDITAPAQNIRQAIQDLTFNFGEVDPVAGEVSLTVYGSVDENLKQTSLQYVQLKRCDWSTTPCTPILSEPIYNDGVRLRKVSTVQLADGSHVAYYLLTFQAAVPFRWAPWGESRNCYLDMVEDVQHYPALTKEGAGNFYNVMLPYLLLHLDTEAEYSLNLPFRPRLWHRRKFNISIVLYFST